MLGELELWMAITALFQTAKHSTETGIKAKSNLNHYIRALSTENTEGGKGQKLSLGV